MSKTTVIFLLVLYFTTACKNVIKEEPKFPESQLENQSIKINKDTIYFKSENIYYQDWSTSTKKEANIYRVITSETDSSHTVENYYLVNNKLLSKGKLANPLGENPLASKYEDTWFYYGDVDIGLYQIGNYRNGMKDGSWYKSYEDAISEIYFYKKDTAITYNDSIKIFNDSNKVIAYGKGVSNNGVPINKWIFNFFEVNTKSERWFTQEENSVVVKFKDYKLNSNEFIEEGSFKEEL